MPDIYSPDDAHRRVKGNHGHGATTGAECMMEYFSHQFVELFPYELARFGLPPPLDRHAHQVSTGFGALDDLWRKKKHVHNTVM